MAVSTVTWRAATGFGGEVRKPCISGTARVSMVEGRWGVAAVWAERVACIGVVSCFIGGEGEIVQCVGFYFAKIR